MIIVLLVNLVLQYKTSALSVFVVKATLGAFVLKSEESGDDLTVGSLFKQKKENKEPVPLTGNLPVLQPVLPLPTRLLSSISECIH